MLPGELLTPCVRERDSVPKEDLRGWRGAHTDAGSQAHRSRREDGREQGDGQPAGAGGGESGRESPAGGRGARVPEVPLAFAALDGLPGSEHAGERSEREDVIGLVLSPPPPRRQPPLLSVGSQLRHTGRVRSRQSREREKHQAWPSSWVQLPERQFPAASEVGRWDRERLRCGECDAWLRDLRACLPRAPLGLLERLLIQFPD